MFTIDFTKPFLYKDIIYFNQGNLAANNILRCKLVTGGDETLEGYIATVTFKTLSHAEINGTVNIVDVKNCIVDIKFPSNALEVGVNELEVILTKCEGIDKVVTPSPIIKYEVWQCITTGNGIQGDSNYPILIDLISDVNNAVRIANNASATADASLKQTAKMLEVVNANITKANETIDNTNSAKDKALNAVEEVNAAKNSMIEDVNSTKNTVVADVNQAKNDMKITVDEAIKFLKQEFNSLTAQQQEELEMLQARDGEVNLNSRLKRDLYIGEKSLKQEVLDLGGLKEVQEMAYSTDKGYLVCKETKVGAIKDLKIYGKSLDNKLPNSFKLSEEYKSIYTDAIDTSSLEPNTVYTIIPICSGNMNRTRFLVNGNINYLDVNTIKPSKFTTPNKIVEGSYRIYLYGENVTQATNSNDKIMLLKGDHTQNPPTEHFEGIASVGNGTDKIEVSSVNKCIDLELGGISTANGELTTGNLRMRSVDFLEYYEMTDILRLDKNKYEILFHAYDENKNYIKPSNGGAYSKDNVKFDVNVRYFKFVIKKINGNAFDLNVDNIYLVKDSEQDKKPLLFKDVDNNTWKPITSLPGYWEGGKFKWGDTIEEHNDGKQYWHKNSCIWDGAIEDLTGLTYDEYYSNDKVKCYWIECNYMKRFTDCSGKIICDKLSTNNVYYKNDIGVSTYTADLTVNPNKNWIYFKLPVTYDTIDKAKEFIKTCKVCSLLAQDEVYEVNPLFLEAYEGETVATVDSGVVNAPIEFKITSYITNLVLLNQQRISILENELYKTNLANFTVALNTLDTKLRLEQLTKAPR